MGIEEEIKVLDENLKDFRVKLKAAKSAKDDYEIKEYLGLISTYRKYKYSLIKTPYNTMIVRGKKRF